MSTKTTKMKMDAFNAQVAGEVRELHDALADAGHPVTPTEAKVLWLVGKAALADVLGLDNTPLVETARRVARDLR
jgi:hypothetical protein